MLQNDNAREVRGRFFRNPVLRESQFLFHSDVRDVFFEIGFAVGDIAEFCVKSGGAHLRGNPYLLAAR